MDALYQKRITLCNDEADRYHQIVPQDVSWIARPETPPPARENSVEPKQTANPAQTPVFFGFFGGKGISRVRGEFHKVGGWQRTEPDRFRCPPQLRPVCAGDSGFERVGSGCYTAGKKPLVAAMARNGSAGLWRPRKRDCRKVLRKLSAGRC